MSVVPYGHSHFLVVEFKTNVDLQLKHVELSSHELHPNPQ